MHISSATAVVPLSCCAVRSIDVDVLTRLGPSVTYMESPGQTARPEQPEDLSHNSLSGIDQQPDPPVSKVSRTT